MYRRVGGRRGPPTRAFCCRVRGMHLRLLLTTLIVLFLGTALLYVDQVARLESRRRKRKEP